MPVEEIPGDEAVVAFGFEEIGSQVSERLTGGDDECAGRKLPFYCRVFPFDLVQVVTLVESLRGSNLL